MAVLAIGALAIAVFVAKSQLPSFDELKSSPNGQMIRVHAAEGLGCPIVGDPRYGTPTPGSTMLLHASSLRLARANKQPVAARAPLPQPFLDAGFADAG